MNATAQTLPVARAPARRTHRFSLLLRREYWEHRGGFLWAPLIAGAISLLLTAVLFVIAAVGLRRAGPDANIRLDDGTQMSVNGLDLGMLAAQMSPEDKAHLASGIDMTMLMASSWPYIVMVFVMFFYCLGALYDERKDRSVLFWKSMPLSDGETVLAKVASATLVLPVLATLAAIATMLVFLVMLSVMVMAHGGNPLELIWGPGNPMLIALSVLAAIPVYAIWALPTIGWLMLCSAWARSVPFLWALLVPVLAGVFVSMFSVMHLFQLDSGWFWKNIVARLLLGVVPMTPYDLGRMDGAGIGEQGILHLLQPAAVYANLLQPATWIGAAAGVAMLLLATRLRRWRDEG
jgi:ABC-2 type transport system permease protein